MHKKKYISLMYTMKALVESKVEDNTKNFAKKQFEILENRRKITFSEHFPHYDELVTV